MDRSRAKELLPVITAYAEGKAIRSRTGDGCLWRDVKDSETVTFYDDFQYCIKPQPREFWILLDDTENHLMTKVYFTSYINAQAACMYNKGCSVVCVKEVIE